MSDLTRDVLALWYYEELDHEDLLWAVPHDGGPITFAAPCSDFFAWGSADAEEITEESFPDLAQAVADVKAVDSYEVSWGGRLYAARRRNMRPQGACYKHIPQVLWPLFDACGPLREVDLDNPRRHPSETS